ncbi:unnamed protein product [Rhodiola kirilowii]
MSIHKLFRSGRQLPFSKYVAHQTFGNRVRQEKVSSRYCSALHRSINGSALHEHAWKTLARHEYRTASFIKIAHIPSVSSQCFGRSPLFFLRCHYATQIAPAAERKSKKMLQYLTVLVFAMVGLTYAAVPMYRRFCQAAGYGGTVQLRESVEEKFARHAKDGTVASREITVQFNANVADGMQWKFIPTQREVSHWPSPGESALAFYTAENKSLKPITGVSTYNVTPMKKHPPSPKRRRFAWIETFFISLIMAAPTAAFPSLLQVLQQSSSKSILRTLL